MKTPPTHACRAMGCSTQIPRFALMCHAHWFMLPKAFQNAIGVALRNYRRTGRKREFLDYRDAVLAAVTHIQRHEQLARDAATPGVVA